MTNIVIDNEKYLEILLGVLDTIHDFYKLDNNNKCIDKITHRVIDFVLDKEPEIRTKYIDYEDVFNKINLQNVDLTNYKKKIYGFLLKNIKRNSKTAYDINKQIITNFKIVFNISIIDIKKFSDEQIISLRIPLYYLIETCRKNDSNFLELLLFILDFMSISIPIAEIEGHIRHNIINITQNVTYPIMFFDDMTSDLNKRLVEFKIINTDKDIIDAAKTEGVDTYFESKKENRLYIDNKRTSLNFHIKPDEDILNFMGAQFYVNNNLIYCKYNDIIFKVKTNIVGRTTQYGLYQTICSLFKIVDFFITDISLDTRLEMIISNAESFILNFKRNVLRLKNMLIRISEYYKQDIKKKISLINFSDINSQDINELYKIILSICLFVQKDKNKTKLIYNGIINNTEYNELINLHKFDLYNKLSLISRNLDENSCIKKKILACIINNSDLISMRQIINIDDLEDVLYLIYSTYYKSHDTNSMKNIIAFLLTGAKRYGDWIQVFLGKKHYFFIQTKDYYCMYRSLLIGAPVCIYQNTFGDTNLKKILIYNYENIPNFDTNYIKTYYGLHTYLKPNESQITEIDNPNNHGLLYFRNKRSVTDYIKTPNISRNYFYKYIKYKIKYYKLKKLIKN